MIRSIWLGLSLFILTPLVANADITQSRQLELRNLLIQDCGSCHGLQMNGGIGPPLLAQSLQHKSIDHIVGTILYGRPGTAMPPWQALLSEDEVHWIVRRLLEGEPQ